MDPETTKRAEDLFLKVCDLPPAEREPILADIGRDQPEVRAQVERMLVRDRDSRLEAVVDSTHTAEHLRVDDAHFEPGAQIGRYRVEHEVARGGMGLIYKVRDEHLQRSLALKVMRPSRSAGKDWSNIERARFLEEAQITAQLDHPGIVPVHELGGQSQSSVYFTMSLVKGINLSELFKLARQEAEGWNLPRLSQGVRCHRLCSFSTRDSSRLETVKHHGVPLWCRVRHGLGARQSRRPSGFA